MLKKFLTALICMIVVLGGAGLASATTNTEAIINYVDMQENRDFITDENGDDVFVDYTEVSFDLINNCGADMEFAPFVAFYADNRLIDVVRAEALEIATDNASEFSVASEIAYTQNADSCKVFVFDDNLKPYSKVAEGELGAMRILQAGAVLDFDVINVYPYNVVITENIGDGEVEILNAVIDGDLIVEGGGSNSIKIRDSGILGKIIANKKSGQAPRIELTYTWAEKIEIKAPTIVEIIDAVSDIKEIVVTDNLEIRGEDVSIEKVLIDKSAEGKVDLILPDALQTEIEVNSDKGIDFGESDISNITFSTTNDKKKTEILEAIKNYIQHIHVWVEGKEVAPGHKTYKCADNDCDEVKNPKNIVSFTLDAYDAYDAGENEITYYKNPTDRACTIAKIDIDEDKDEDYIFCNGSPLPSKDPADYFGDNYEEDKMIFPYSARSGRVILIDNDSYSGYDIICIEMPTYAVVDKVREDGENGMVFFKNIPESFDGQIIEYICFEKEENPTNTILAISAEGTETGVATITSLTAEIDGCAIDIKNTTATSKPTVTATIPANELKLGEDANVINVEFLKPVYTEGEITDWVTVSSEVVIATAVADTATVVEVKADKSLEEMGFKDAGDMFAVRVFANDATLLVDGREQVEGKVMVIFSDSVGGIGVSQGNVKLPESTEAEMPSTEETEKPENKEPDTYKGVYLTKDGKAINYTELCEDDVLSIMWNPNKDVYYIEVVNNKIEGAISMVERSRTSKDGYKYTIDGKAYDVAEGYDGNGTLKAGASGIFYVDNYGKIVAYYKDDVTSGNCAYFIKASVGSDGWSEKVRVQLIDKSGEVYTAYLADQIDIENASYDVREAASMSEADGTVKIEDIDCDAFAELLANQLVTYAANSAGEINAITFAKAGEDENTLSLYAAGNATFDEEDREATINGKKVTITDDTIVFFIKGSSAISAIGDMDNFANVAYSKVGTGADVNNINGYAAAYDVDDDDRAKVLVILNATGGMSASAPLAVLESIGKASVNGGTTFALTYWMKGERATSYIAADCIGFNAAAMANDMDAGGYVGDLYKLNLSGTFITELAKYADAPAMSDNPADADVAWGFVPAELGGLEDIIWGPVVDKSTSSDWIKIAQKMDGVYDYEFIRKIKNVSSANVYVVDVFGRSQVYTGTIADAYANIILIEKDEDGSIYTQVDIDKDGVMDVAAGTQALGMLDYVVAYTYDDDAVDVIIYKAYDFEYKLAKPGV